MDKISLEKFVKESKNLIDNTEVCLNDERLFVFTRNEEYLMNMLQPKPKSAINAKDSTNSLDSTKEPKCTGK